VPFIAYLWFQEFFHGDGTRTLYETKKCYDKVWERLLAAVESGPISFLLSSSFKLQYFVTIGYAHELTLKLWYCRVYVERITHSFQAVKLLYTTYRKRCRISQNWGYLARTSAAGSLLPDNASCTGPSTSGKTQLLAKFAQGKFVWYTTVSSRWIRRAAVFRRTFTDNQNNFQI